MLSLHMLLTFTPVILHTKNYSLSNIPTFSFSLPPLLYPPLCLCISGSPSRTLSHKLCLSIQAFIPSIPPLSLFTSHDPLSRSLTRSTFISSPSLPLSLSPNTIAVYLHDLVFTSICPHASKHQNKYNEPALSMQRIIRTHLFCAHAFHYHTINCNKPVVLVDFAAPCCCSTWHALHTM